MHLKNMKATFHQLEVFEQVAKRLSFTKAAQDLGLSQPTVSAQMKQLTDEVGMPIFEQIGKSIHLTHAGNELLETAQALRGHWARFESTIAGMQGLTKGTLKLACVTTAKYFTPELLGKYCERYPEVDVKLEIANRQTLIERLRDNKDDIYIMVLPPNDIEIAALPFQINKLVVIAPAKHPLVGQKGITLDQLASERFILREKGSGTRSTVSAFFAKHDFEPTVRMELGSNEAIKHSVAAGLGLSVLSQHVLDADPAHDNLAILDINDFPLIEHWHAITPKGKKLSIAAQAFLEMLKPQKI